MLVPACSCRVVAWRSSGSHHGEVICGRGVQGGGAHRRPQAAETAKDTNLMQEVAGMTESHGPHGRVIVPGNQV